MTEEEPVESVCKICGQPVLNYGQGWRHEGSSTIGGKHRALPNEADIPLTMPLVGVAAQFAEPQFQGPADPRPSAPSPAPDCTSCHGLGDPSTGGVQGAAERLRSPEHWRTFEEDLATVLKGLEAHHGV